MSDNKDYVENENIINEEDDIINDNFDKIDEDTDNDDSVNNSNDDKDFEDVCYLCKRTESRAGKMINIPGNICICADCMQKTMNSFSSMGPGGLNLGGFDLSGDDKDNPFGNIMGVNIMNFSDFQDMMSKKQKIKKKKETKANSKKDKKDEKVEDIFDIKNIPAPHIIR